MDGIKIDVAKTTGTIHICNDRWQTIVTIWPDREQARTLVDGLTAWLASKAEQPADSPPLVKTGQGEYEEVHCG